MSVNAWQVVRRIGDMPVGDPTAMMAHAAQLRADADRLVELAVAANRRAMAAVFEGPAADRFRADIEDCLRDAQMRADRLHQAAADLQRAATRVAASQSAWRLQFRRVEAELVAAARAATGR